jgi:hypothetical protein
MIKAARPCGRAAFGLRVQRAYLLVLSFSCVWLLVAGAELELELDWPLVAPAPAEPLGVLPEVELELELGLDEAPPPALFFSSVVAEAEPEAEPEGEVVAPEGLELDEDEAEPDGVVAGEEVAPDEDEEPEGVVVSRVVRFALLSPQAARPRARDTAAARMESFMCSPPWLGYGLGQQALRPRAVSAVKGLASTRKA